VAVIGSGPAGLACAQQLNTAGHTVVVIERDPPGGGSCATASPISNWKSPVVDRRLDLMRQEGIVFKPAFKPGWTSPEMNWPPISMPW
jgi:glutamate synthase (NADPH/NADH) small chain